MKVVIIFLSLFVCVTGYFLGKNSFSQMGEVRNQDDPLNGQEELKRLGKENFSIIKSGEIGEVSKINKISSTKKEAVLASREEKEAQKRKDQLGEMAKLTNQLTFVKGAREKFKKIIDEINEDPQPYIFDAQDLIMGDKINVREQQILIQLVMNFSLDQDIKFNFLENVFKKKMSRDLQGNADDNCYVKMTALKIMLEKYPFEEIEDLIMKNLVDQDSSLVHSFIISPVLEKYPEKKELFRDFKK